MALGRRGERVEPAGNDAAVGGLDRADGDEVDAGAVKAAYRNGILTVTLPKAPAAQVRNIPVTSS